MARTCCAARVTMVTAIALRQVRPTGRAVGASIHRKLTVIRTRATATTVTTSTGANTSTTSVRVFAAVTRTVTTAARNTDVTQTAAPASLEQSSKEFWVFN